MSKCLIIVTLFALLAGESHAATVERKRYVYLYESARDTGSDSEYVIRDNTHRSPLLPEPKALPLALRFGGVASHRATSIIFTNCTYASREYIPLS